MIEWPVTIRGRGISGVTLAKNYGGGNLGCLVPQRPSLLLLSNLVSNSRQLFITVSRFYTQVRIVLLLDRSVQKVQGKASSHCSRDDSVIMTLSSGSQHYIFACDLLAWSALPAMPADSRRNIILYHLCQNSFQQSRFRRRCLIFRTLR